MSDIYKDQTESTVVVDVPYSSPRDLLIQFRPARLCEERRITVITTTTHEGIRPCDVYQTTLAQTNQRLEYVAQQTNKDAKHTPAYSSTGHLQLQTIFAHTHGILKEPEAVYERKYVQNFVLL